MGWGLATHLGWVQAYRCYRESRGRPLFFLLAAVPSFTKIHSNSNPYFHSEYYTSPNLISMDIWVPEVS